MQNLVVGFLDEKSCIKSEVYISGVVLQLLEEHRLEIELFLI
jgi:hypothetical protein